MLETIRKIIGKGYDFPDVLGQDKAKIQLKSALLMGRHIALFGPPGVGKTTLAKNVARILPKITVNTCGYNCLPDNPICPRCKSQTKLGTKEVEGEDRFVRVQGSPDLTAEDLLGDIDPIKAMKYGPLSPEAFTPGKVFKANNGILFFDEINRCPEKLQNALLQVLQEKKATIGSYDIDFEANFILIATMNPFDTNTEKLSDVLLDRLDVVYVTYPETIELEKEIITTNGKNLVEVSPSILNTIAGFVRNLRKSDKLEKFPSVRASLGLYERSQSLAYLKGKKAVSIDEINESVVSVIAHRIRLKPSIKYLKEQTAFVKEEFERFQQDQNLSTLREFETGGGP